MAPELRQDQKNKGISLMAEGQKKGQIGKGMKPIGNKRVKPQKQTKRWRSNPQMRDSRRALLEPVLSCQEGNETPGNLDPGLRAIRDIAERLVSIGIVASAIAECTAPHEANRIAADAQTSAALNSKFWNGCLRVFLSAFRYRSVINSARVI